MIINLWKKYRDIRYQNPCLIEQARSLDYRYIRYENLLISREYEEELLAYLLNGDEIYYEDLLDKINLINNSNNEISCYQDKILVSKDLDFKTFVIKKTKEINNLAVIMSTLHYNKTTEEKFMYNLAKLSNKSIISNNYQIGADIIVSEQSILTDSTIDLIYITKECATEFSSLIDWKKVIVF